ncbi:hypothetical protein WME94_54190 [Sorangium sp. So ce429]
MHLGNTVQPKDTMDPVVQHLACGRRRREERERGGKAAGGEEMGLG